MRLQDGELHLLQADPIIEVADELLGNLDGRRASYADGIFTIHALNGEVSYGLCQYDDIRETWVGIRSDFEETDDDD